jgi:predicted metalloprotease with PDZ domain
LWLAEGFTQYYGDLIMARAGLADREQTAAGLTRAATAIVNGPGRQFRSAVGMSQHAPYTDAARSVDRTNFSTTWISYYTYGSAVALALDLSLRDRSNGKLSLDDYMRALWRVHGKPGGPQPGLVAKPYTLKDARDRLADVSGDRAFADAFFDKYVEGREVVDYARLLSRAGLVYHQRNPAAAWIGNANVDGSGTITNLVAWGSPIFDAGLDQGDVILDIGGKPIAGGVIASVLKVHKPGDHIPVSFKRRNGATGTATIIAKADPSLETVTIESSGGTLTPDQKAFRDAWLGSKAR